jgi:hypothetical protein
MRNRFDQLGKQIGRQALGASGPTVVHDEIVPDAHHADLRHEPDPARHAERARLGLLGRIAAVVCLIELYGHAPSAEELRACLAKHIAFWHQRARKARPRGRQWKGKKRPPEAFVAPFLWILAPAFPAALRTELGLQPAPGWPSGVYFFGGDVLRVGIVVASELPRARETLLVRVMVAGPLLRHAIPDLFELPPDARERVVAEPILVSLGHAIETKPSRTAEAEATNCVPFYKRFRRDHHHAADSSVRRPAAARAAGDQARRRCLGTLRLRSRGPVRPDGDGAPRVDRPSAADGAARPC